MNAAEIAQRYPEAFNAYKKWWRALTLKGDPARMPNISWEAFKAGYEIGTCDAAEKAQPPNELGAVA